MGARHAAVEATDEVPASSSPARLGLPVASQRIASHRVSSALAGWLAGIAHAHARTLPCCTPVCAHVGVACLASALYLSIHRPHTMLLRPSGAVLSQASWPALVCPDLS